MELSTQHEQTRASSDVRIRAEDGELHAALWMPADAVGVVVLAGENGAQRLPGTGDYLPGVLREARLGIVAFDVGRPQGAGDDSYGQARTRLQAACAWVQRQPALSELPLGLIGLGVGATAALQVAAVLGRRLCALVARGAQGELRVLEGLNRISAPTLLIAGGLDERAVQNSRLAYAALRCKKRFEIVPGATRAFDEPGSFEVVARLARNWFLQHVHQLH